MRNLVLALAAAGGALAFTGAAASALTVGGPLNPRSGSDIRNCDLGTITVTTLDDGTNITGFRVTAANASDGQECTGATVYVAIDDTLAADLPAGWDFSSSAVIGADGDAGDLRFSAPATSFTTAASKAVTFSFDMTATNKIYGWEKPVTPPVTTAYTSEHIYVAPSIEAVGVGTASVLLSENTPSTGAFLTPVEVIP